MQGRNVDSLPEPADFRGNMRKSPDPECDFGSRASRFWPYLI
jgi:hypothetical protein